MSQCGCQILSHAQGCSLGKHSLEALNKRSGEQDGFRLDRGGIIQRAKAFLRDNTARGQKMLGKDFCSLTALSIFSPTISIAR